MASSLTQRLLSWAEGGTPTPEPDEPARAERPPPPLPSPLPRPVSKETLPADPSQRTIILVLREHDIEQFGYEPDAQDLLLADEVHLLPYPVAERGPILSALDDKGLLRPGVMLVQSPFAPDDYEDVTSAPEQFALRKYMVFSALCQRLGAREVTVTRVDAQTTERSDTLEAKGKKGVVAGGVEVENQRAEELKQRLSLHHTYAGGEPDVEGAERLLREHRLWGDAAMRGLVDLRRERGNALQRQRLQVDLSKESTAKLSVAASLKVPAFVTLTADYERAAKEKVRYTLTLDVDF